jgi:peroxiredoxin
MKTRWIIAATAAAALALLTLPLITTTASRASEDRAAAKGDSIAARTATCDADAVKPAKLDFVLEDMNGERVKLSDFKGKVILLNFWATWCGPCEQEIPAFVEMYDRYKDRGFVILGVSIDDPPEALRAYAKSHRMQYPVLQMQSDVEDAYGPIFGVPMSYFIARDGSICKRHLGPATREQVERELKALL